MRGTHETGPLRLAAIALSAMLAAFGTVAVAAAADPLVVETASGDAVEFDVEVARTAEQRSVGLMHRDRLEPMAGMLFVYPGPQEVSMWMHATRMPLDMFFIGPDGTIVKIRERAVPYSEEVISSGEPVVAVLEVNGGTATRYGIRPGDRVLLPESAR
jgi:uncharacterized membrane protein (UPF0127 family)